MKYGVLHIDSHSASHHLILRNLALDLHALDGVGLGMEGDGAHLAHGSIAGYGLVAYAANLGNDVLHLARNDEITVFVAHATSDECGVGNRQK